MREYYHLLEGSVEESSGFVSVGFSGVVSVGGSAAYCTRLQAMRYECSSDDNFGAASSVPNGIVSRTALAV